VADTLSKIKSFSGSSGDFTFDADGNAHKKVNFYVVQNSKIMPLKK
jgi:hypothetical protein